MRYIIDNKYKDYILERLTEVDIFSYYFDISSLEIWKCLSDKNYKVINNLRQDTSPSLGFMYQHDGKIRSKDWGDDKYSGDIFEVIGNIYGLDSNYNRDFIKICKYIIRDILDGDENISISTDKDKEKLGKLLKKKVKDYIKIIEYEEKEVTKEDIRYWNKINVNPSYLSSLYNTYIAKRVWINNYLFYEYSPENPCYIYFLGFYRGINLLKVYQPLTEIKENKFRTNNGFDLECLYSLKNNSDILMINKSRKDSISVAETLRQLKADINISFINYTSESTRLNPKMVNILRSKAKRIINFTDNDEAGIKCAEYHSSIYGFESYFSILKDYTDTIANKDYRYEEIRNLIQFLLWRNEKSM